eukprot:scaffold190544_cov31-Tisochrysis_lutea.AAC.1
MHAGHCVRIRTPQPDRLWRETGCWKRSGRRGPRSRARGDEPGRSTGRGGEAQRGRSVPTRGVDADGSLQEVVLRLMEAEGLIYSIWLRPDAQVERGDLEPKCREVSIGQRDIHISSAS